MGKNLTRIKPFNLAYALGITLGLSLAFTNCAPNGFESSPLPINTNGTTPIGPTGDDEPGGTAPPPIVSNDPGRGSWWVDSNRMIADQTGNEVDDLDYVPGCLNGERTTNGSSGCALRDNNNGFSFAPNKILGLRFTSKSTVSSSVRYFKFYNNFGSNVGSTFKAWLSDDPTSTYESVVAECRSFVSSVGYVMTGPGHCTIIPNKRYYLFIRDDSGSSGNRYIVDEKSADLD